MSAPTIGPASHQRTTVAMGTLVSVEVVSARPSDEAEAAIGRALGWLATVERAASRFDPASELRRLVARVGEDVPVSPLLLEAVRFALALAELTDGAFDPTVGRLLAERGFDRHHVTGQAAGAVAADRAATYRDVVLDSAAGTIRLRRPLLLDLGAVAKGLAVDLAARELSGFESVCVDAGGDLYARGRSAAGRPWRIGVQDPRRSGEESEPVYQLEVVDGAVCTSGDYERRTADGRDHHLVDPRSGASARGLASVTVVAPTAMAADGLATAAFVLGRQRGRRLLEAQGVGGVFVDAGGRVTTTRGLPRPAR